MANDITKDEYSQVKKVSPYTSKDLDEHPVYYTQQGVNFASVTYLGVPPKGSGGRKEALSDTKEAANLRRSMKKLMGIIRANFGIDVEREAHITLTYRGSMTDTDRLRLDLQVFIRGLREGYSDYKFDYVAVMEPHGHGGWHIHLLLKSDKPLWHTNGVVGLCFDRVRKIWRKAIGGDGANRHSKLPEDVKDFGAYFAAYFVTAIPEDVELSGNREEIKEASKAAVKGSRLKYYPANFKFYRTSRGIIRPKAIKTSYNHEEIVKNYKIQHTEAYAIMCDDEPGKAMQYIQTMDFKRR